MPSCDIPVSGYALRDRTLMRGYGYAPECGNADCESCALRNPAGYDFDGYDSEGYDRNGYDRNGEDVDGNDQCANGDCTCYEHNEDESEGGGLHYYSYTPMLKFHGEKPPWFGMELEVTTDRTRHLAEVVEGYAGDLIYCKEDGSVQGAELVTHPMSYQWAMDKFPWELLPALRDEADATVIATDNGIHIHVSRDGFDNSAHMHRWLKFWYRNPSDIQRLARRRADYWAAFNPEHRKAQREHVKRGKPGYDERNDRPVMLGQRYAAINTTNDATLEVRVFASTLRPQRAKAALQLVAGSVEYARQLDAYAVTHKHGWEWPAFISWAGKAGIYGELIAENRIRRYH